MATIALALHKGLEDPLNYLPCSTILAYRKNQVIYSRDQPSTSIYVVIDGTVKVSRLADDGHLVVVDVYRANEFFGEGAFLNHLTAQPDQASALENTKVMAWPKSDIEDLVMKRPRLAVALLQVLAQRAIDFTERIESFSIDSVARRLARSLIRFSERLGTPQDNVSIGIAPFTHELLSRYVGTSRENVTQLMNQFRREGYLRYSRKGIVIHRDALRDWLQKKDIVTSEAPPVVRALAPGNSHRESVRAFRAGKGHR
jgi:CRP/FNR family transcriptional regulator, cyclic AMP receptor protein